MRRFAFFGDKLSRKAGEKCCEYGQNGIPLSEEYIKEFLGSASESVKYWRPSENFEMLSHSWYFTNYLQACRFAQEIAKIDSRNVLKQMPNIHIFRKELLRVELTTPKLGGLSYADLTLAVIISLIPPKEFSLTPIASEKNFRKELRMKALNNSSAET